jgi:hypothetical protein
MTNHVSELVCTGDLAEPFRSLSIFFPPQVMSLVQTRDRHPRNARDGPRAAA